jgi:hypothetical protein
MQIFEKQVLALNAKRGVTAARQAKLGDAPESAERI